MALKTLVTRTLIPVAVAAAVLLPTTASAAPTLKVITGEDVLIDHVQTGTHISPYVWQGKEPTNVYLFEDWDSNLVKGEQWRFERLWDDTFRIKTADPEGDMCLEPEDVRYRQLITTKKCSGSKEQQVWDLERTDTGVRNGFTIRPSTNNGLAITPREVPATSGTYLVLSTLGDYDSQVFRTRAATGEPKH